MIDQRSIKAGIQAVIREMMDRVMNNVLIDAPFDEEEFLQNKPLYAALVPIEIFKGSHFERRFVTPFGGVWERLARVVATQGLGVATCGTPLSGTIRQGRLNRISETLNRLEHTAKGSKRVRPSWNSELEYVLEGDGDAVPVTVICDFLARNDKTGERFAFEIKAPLPNSDQTKVSKEKLFKLCCMEPRQVDAAYYALPYNPYGKKTDYAWPFPGRWFDMQSDEVVLIGDEFWEKLGGPGTYQAFIDAVNEIGPEFQMRIFREYLGVEPPPGFSEQTRLREPPPKTYGSIE